MIVVIFFIFFFVAVAFEQKGYANKNALLVLSCIVLAFIAGIRDIYYWPDAFVYAWSFMNYTPDITDYSISDKPYGYSEKGFYFLAVIVKTIFDNVTVFMLFISGLTFYFLYKDLKEFSIFPLVGLCAYIARFYFCINFIQLRSVLEYAILITSLK